VPSKEVGVGDSNDREADRRRTEAGAGYDRADDDRTRAYEQRRREQELRDAALWQEWNAQQSAG
jgi:hypothetical protein